MTSCWRIAGTSILIVTSKPFSSAQMTNLNFPLKFSGIFTIRLFSLFWFCKQVSLILSICQKIFPVSMGLLYWSKPVIKNSFSSPGCKQNWLFLSPGKITSWLSLAGSIISIVFSITISRLFFTSLAIALTSTFPIKLSIENFPTF